MYEVKVILFIPRTQNPYISSRQNHNLSILLFKGLHLFEPDFFLFQNTHTFLYLSRDKPKG